MAPCIAISWSWASVSILTNASSWSFLSSSRRTRCRGSAPFLCSLFCYCSAACRRAFLFRGGWGIRNLHYLSTLPLATCYLGAWRLLPSLGFSGICQCFRGWSYWTSRACSWTWAENAAPLWGDTSQAARWGCLPITAAWSLLIRQLRCFRECGSCGWSCWLLGEQKPPRWLSSDRLFRIRDRGWVG